MANNFFDPDDATIPIQPPKQRHAEQQGQQGQQGQGNFYEPPPPARRPYQYPPSQQQQPPIQGQPPTSMPVSPAARTAPKMNMPPAQPYPAYPPYQQPGRIAETGKASPLPPKQPPKRARRRPRLLIGCLAAVILFFVLVSFIFSTAQRVLAFGAAISPQTPLSTQTGYMNISTRTNLLVMGYGGLGHDGAYLTDSMVVVSVNPLNKHTTLVSVPRDLWIQYPPSSGQYTKINSIYEFGSNFNKNPVAGGDAAAQKISLVTGLNVKYWITINFAGFRDLINSIGGIDVYVPNAFNACYPANDDPNINASWIKIQFNKGTQHMDGETAIRYARAREPLEVCGKGTSMNLAELTDFARSARQQIIIKAVLTKIKQISTWPKLFDAMTALQHTIYTNMSLADLSAFALKMNLSDPHTAHVGLSNQNVLVDSQSSDGQYILLPQNNNWQLITDYVKQHLYN